MNGVHDLGGMHGFGPIVRKENEPHFQAAWEARVRAAMTLSIGKHFTIDASRHGIELIPPAEYLRAPYFERWLASLEYNLIQHGLVTADELDARTEFFREHPGADPPRASGVVTPPPRAQKSPPVSPTPSAPRFAMGDAVVTRNFHPRGHTRLPRYARGKRGLIHLIHGPQTFPDTNAHGLGEQPQVLYHVRFEGQELWGESSEPREAVYLDLWESYLEPSPT